MTQPELPESDKHNADTIPAAAWDFLEQPVAMGPLVRDWAKRYLEREGYDPETVTASVGRVQDHMGEVIALISSAAEAALNDVTGNGELPRNLNEMRARLVASDKHFGLAVKAQLPELDDISHDAICNAYHRFCARMLQNAESTIIDAKRGAGR